MSAFDRAIFHDEESARAWLEGILWPHGTVCPHCGLIGCAYKLNGKKQRAGLYKCKGCEEQFTVTIGTIFERSHIKLHVWLQAFFLMMASKKGMSAHQMHRMLHVTYKTAWFMCHRIREALRDDAPLGPLGGQNKVVEVDETYVGGKSANRKNYVPAKTPVVALVEREGRVRARAVPSVNGENLKPILAANVHKGSYLMTDDSTVYPPIVKNFAGHGTVNHSAEEYVRTGGFHHTNTVESYFSILKRGIIGTYHHVSAQHLKRYLAEFDFRYNERAALEVDDFTRTMRALLGAKGKRLTYKQGTSDGEAAV